jgi:hypothetical protein
MLTDYRELAISSPNRVPTKLRSLGSTTRVPGHWTRWVLALLVVGIGWYALAQTEKAKPKPKPTPRPVTSPSGAAFWIWHDEGEPAREAPVGTRYFRRVWEINRPTQIVVDEATLDITADNAFTVWINGKRIGSGSNWSQVIILTSSPIWCMVATSWLWKHATRAGQLVCSSVSPIRRMVKPGWFYTATGSGSPPRL